MFQAQKGSVVQGPEQQSPPDGLASLKTSLRQCPLEVKMWDVLQTEALTKGEEPCPRGLRGWKLSATCLPPAQPWLPTGAPPCPACFLLPF